MRSSPQPSSEARADETDDDEIDDDDEPRRYRVSRNRPGLSKTSASVAPRVDEKVSFFTRVMTVLSRINTEKPVNTKRPRVYSPLRYSTFATFLLHRCPVLGHSISSQDAATMSSPVNGDLARTTPSSFAAVVR